MLIKDLGGHSGCKILLLEENNIYFVRKFSASVDYNKRLEKQCIKQEKFVGQSIKTPKILKKGYDSNGLFYYDMEYVQGITLAKYISKIDVSKICDIVNLIIKNIDFSINSNVDQSIFKNKILDLKNKTKHLQNTIVNDAIVFLSNFNWSDFCESDCHGDLTLENIIVKNGDIYYIDFLDSFYDSWILDFGKLLQDTECMWSYRNTLLDTNTKLRLVIFRDILLKKLNSIDEKYVQDSYVALLLCLIRIYPYTSDEKTISFLNDQVNYILAKIRR